MLHWGDVAFAPAEWKGKHLHLEQLQVLEEHRNRGIGSALLAAAERAASDRRREFVSLGLGIDNPNAHRLYERLGYRDAGLAPIEDGGEFLDRNGNKHRWRETWVFLLKDLSCRPAGFPGPVAEVSSPRLPQRLETQKKFARGQERRELGSVRKLGEGAGLGRFWDGLLQGQQPPAHVVPATELETHVRIYGHALEAHRFVDADARFVGQSDACICLVITKGCDHRQQRAVEAATDPVSVKRGVHVDRDVHRPPIGKTVAVARSVGIANYLAVVLAHEPGQRLQTDGHSFTHLVLGGRRCLE
jgi:hypothetical protein